MIFRQCQASGHYSDSHWKSYSDSHWWDDQVYVFGKSFDNILKNRSQWQEEGLEMQQEVILRMLVINDDCLDHELSTGVTIILNKAKIISLGTKKTLNYYIDLWPSGAQT